MTDPQTLLLAYLREEYQIAPYQARVLMALYDARRALSTRDLSDASGVPVPSLKPGLCALRRVLGDEWLAPPAAICMAGRDRQIRYALTSEGRAEIEAGLRSAITGLLARLVTAERVAA